MKVIDFKKCTVKTWN